MRDGPDRRWIALALALGVGAVAVGLRVANAVTYFPLFGFDAPFHWQYVEVLLERWRLPSPEAGWSASRPPLFFWLAAAVARLVGATGPEAMERAVVAVRLVIAAVGLVPAWLAARLVARRDPERPLRAVLAGALVLFVPAHIALSAMFNEEILVATLTSVGVVAALRLREAGGLGASTRGAGAHGAVWRTAGVGLACGLAAMTKLTGALAGIAVLAAWTIAALREGGPPRVRAQWRPLAATAVVGAAVGGWFYAHHLVRYGYVVPHSLAAHQPMYRMPPGERRVGDYVRFPLSTFTDARAISFDLQRSVWGTTYASLWFDAHRFFVPRDAANARPVGAAILLLALLPTAAFLVGAARATRRALRERASPDLELVLLCALTLAGYVAFTWRNPWYATVKGSYLLGLSVPFGVWTSGVLCDWASGSRARAWAIAGALAALGVLVALAFSFETPLWAWDTRTTPMPGFPYFVPSAP